jgi:hypothetical protein
MGGISHGPLSSGALSVVERNRQGEEMVSTGENAKGMREEKADSSHLPEKVSFDLILM